MSKYTVRVDVDGAVEQEVHGLSITGVANFVEDTASLALHQLEEFLTDLMIETEAAVATWEGSTKVVYYGHREY